MEHYGGLNRHKCLKMAIKNNSYLKQVKIIISQQY